MNIKAVGLERFLNERYATKGTKNETPYQVFVRLKNNKKAASEHFGVSRKQIYEWLEYLPTAEAK